MQERVWNVLAGGGLSRREVMALALLTEEQAWGALRNMRRAGLVCVTGHNVCGRWFRTPGVAYPGDMRGMKPRSRANLRLEAKKRSKTVPDLSWSALL